MNFFTNYSVTMCQYYWDTESGMHGLGVRNAMGEWDLGFDFEEFVMKQTINKQLQCLMKDVICKRHLHL